jgi:hypothetical protein
MAHWANRLLKQRGIKVSSARLTSHKKTIVDGVAFASKFEADGYRDLLLMEAAGLIRDIRMQVTFRLTPSFKWKADFQYFDLLLNQYVVLERKGVMSDRFRCVLQLWKDFGPYLLIVHYQCRNGYISKEYPCKETPIES